MSYTFSVDFPTGTWALGTSIRRRKMINAVFNRRSGQQTIKPLTVLFNDIIVSQNSLVIECKRFRTTLYSMYHRLLL